MNLEQPPAKHPYLAFIIYLDALLFGYLLDVAIGVGPLVGNSAKNTMDFLQFVVFVYVPLAILIALLYQLARTVYVGDFRMVRKIAGDQLKTAIFFLALFTITLVCLGMYYIISEDVRESLPNERPWWVFIIVVCISFIGGEIFYRYWRKISPFLPIKPKI